VLSFAQANGLGRYTFWSVNRDRECNPPSNNGSLSSECSSVTQNAWDFTAYTVAFAKSAPVTQPTGSPTPTSGSSTPTPTPTSGSCPAAWSSSSTYVSGNVVSYNGEKWTANQWNYDEVPGGPSGAWNNNGAC
jgi:chitinase